jgi:uncharacterized protein
LDVAVEYVWDQANIGHIARHRVKPGEVEQVLTNDPLEIDFEVIGGEQRWTSVGHTNALRVLLVIWTVRNQSIRPVTAYPVTKRTAREYIAGKGL